MRKGDSGSDDGVYKKKARCVVYGGRVQVEENWERSLCYELYLSVPWAPG